MAIEIDYYITMVSKNNELVNLKGSSLNFSAHGWWGKEKNNAAPKKPLPPLWGVFWRGRTEFLAKADILIMN